MQPQLAMKSVCCEGSSQDGEDGWLATQRDEGSNLHAGNTHGDVEHIPSMTEVTEATAGLQV